MLEGNNLVHSVAEMAPDISGTKLDFGAETLVSMQMDHT